MPQIPSDRCLEFVRTRTVPTPVPLTPEIETHQAAELKPLWRAMSPQMDCPLPYWAFPWAGGQGLARYLLDHPEAVRGKRVLDFAAGSGLVAIAAVRAGAAEVVATDLDPYSEAATWLNAKHSGAQIEFTSANLLGSPLEGFEVVLAGDIFYDRWMAQAGMQWFRTLTARGLRVLAGDPGRLYTPQTFINDLAEYQAPTSLEIEDRPVMRTWVMEVLPGLPAA